jgi:putative ABC transport system permease protein
MSSASAWTTGPERTAWRTPSRSSAWPETSAPAAYKPRLIRKPIYRLPPPQLVNMVKAAIQSSNPGQAVFGVMTMLELLADSERQPRFHVYLIGAFALLAVAMAAAGMYSVISCLVSQRTSEIAIRIALGATGRAIIRTMLAATSAWVIAGLGCGLGLGLATRNTVRALSSTAVQGSPWMYVLVIVFFLLVTLLAAYLPLRRAARLDPAVALRAE